MGAMPRCRISKMLVRRIRWLQSPSRRGRPVLRSTRSTGRTSPIRADTLARSIGVPLDLDVGCTIRRARWRWTPEYIGSDVVSSLSAEMRKTIGTRVDEPNLFYLFDISIISRRREEVPSIFVDVRCIPFGEVNSPIILWPSGFVNKKSWAMNHLRTSDNGKDEK